MRLDRKLLLIAPVIVLLFVTAGLAYTATQMNLLRDVGDNWKNRSDFIAAVQRGEKPLQPEHAIELLRRSLEVEQKRTEAIIASRDLLFLLSAIALASCIVLIVGIRGVPREHWPRFNSGRQQLE
jgi:hypothetical protein